MPPPNVPGVPGMPLPPAAQPIQSQEDGPPNVRPRVPTRAGMPAPPRESRPPPSNPPPEELAPRELQQSRQEIVIEADDRQSVVDFGRNVRMSYGKAAFVGPVWVFVLVLIVGLLAANLYFTARRGDLPANVATKDDVRSSDAKYEALNLRVTALTEKAISDYEQLHNDLVDLKLKIIEQKK